MLCRTQKKTSYVQCLLRDTTVIEPPPKVTIVKEADVDKQLQDYAPPMSIEDFRSQGYQMIDIICDYLR